MLTAAPVAVYHFDEGTDTTTADAVGGNHGVLGGDFEPTWVSPKVGTAALAFQGDGAYKGMGSRVEVPNSLNAVLGGSASLAVWVKTTQIGNATFWMSPSITGSEHAGDGNDVFWGTLTSGGNIEVRHGDGPAATSTTRISDGAWHYVAFTRDAVTGEERVYVDGVFEAGVFGVPGIATTDFNAIGAATDVAFSGGGIEGYNHFEGELDELTIGDRVWSAAEVAALAAGTSVPAPNAAPSDLAVASVGPFSVTLQWQDHSSNEAGFQIERSLSGAEGTFVTVGGAPAGATSGIDITALPATHYFYRVKAVTLGGESDPTNVADATTSADPLSRGPDGFGYSATFGTAVDVNLVPGADGVQQFLSGSDDEYTNVDLRANTFDFYGHSYSGDQSVYVATNGLISFGFGDPAVGHSDLGFFPGQPVIAALWDDWVAYYDADASVLTKLVDGDSDGVADQLVIQWNMLRHFGFSTSTVTFQAILQLNTNGAPGEITLSYPDIDTGDFFTTEGSNASVGMKDEGYQFQNGANRLLFSYDGNTGFVGTGKSINVQWHADPNDAPPVANAGGPYNVAVSTFRRLNGTGSSDPDQGLTPLIYQWDLDGDGVFGERGFGAGRGDETIDRPVFFDPALEIGAAVPVALRVVDRRGKVSAVSHTVVNIVENRGPTADIGGPYTVTGGGMVNLDASGTTDPDEDLDSLRFDWDLNGDGYYGTGFTEHGYEFGPFTTFFAQGLNGPRTYAIHLRVTDAAGHESFAHTDVTILENQPPHAAIGGPTAVSQGNFITLNGLGSFDPDDDPSSLQYAWDFNNNEIYGEGYTEQGFEFGQFATFIASGVPVGTWPVRLQVTDPAGNSHVATVDLTIRPNVAPVADAGGPYTVPEGRDVRLSARGSRDPDGDPLQYLWDLDNDGSFDAFDPDPNFSATSLAGGAPVTVRLRLVDTAGNVSETMTTVNVTQAAPVLQNVSVTNRVNEDFYANIRGAIFDTTADSETVTIDWGDGTVESFAAQGGWGFSYDHLYADNGHYPVQFTVSDADGSDTGVASDRALNLLWVGFNTLNPGDAFHMTQVYPWELAGQSFAGFDVIYVDSNNYGFESVLQSRAQDFADFVSAGGGLVVEGGGSFFNPDYSWVPNHNQLEWWPDGHADVTVTPAGWSHRITANLTNAWLNYPYQNQANFFTATGGMQVLTTQEQNVPNTLAGTFGAGRIVYTGLLASNLQYALFSYRMLIQQAAWWAGGNNGPAAVFSVDVDNVAPVLSATGSESVDEGANYTLNLTSYDPGDDTITSWTIDWGDGNVQTFPGNPSSVTHAYADNGSYDIRASATDEDGTWSTSRLTQWSVADGGNGHFYLFTLDAGSWTHAEEQAVAAGGHLVSITSQREQDFIVAHFLNGGREFQTYWIGLTDAADEGHFAWTTTESIDSYNNWLPGEPNDASGQEDYAALNWFFPKGFGAYAYWNDVGVNGAPEYGDNGFNGIIELDRPVPDVRVSVNSAAPAISTVSSPGSVIGGATPRVAVSLSAAFADPGVLDTHSATIDWGDGNTTDAALSESNGAGTVSGTHAYAKGGVYTATLWITDDDGAATSNSVTVYVSGAGVHQGVVQVVGTAAADKFKVERLADGAYLVTNELRGTTTRLTAEPGVPISGVLVVLGAGDDKVNVTGSVTVPAVVDGGAGNDQLNGSNACNVLLGGAGDDTLTGGNGRDILIGGLGADRILGNGGDDILIGGYTAWDNYDAAYTGLQAALAEWCRTDVNYAGRVAHLKEGGGLNGSVAFDGTSVFDDRTSDVLTSDATDTLTGGAGDDWFLGNFAGGGKLDNVTDGKAGELKTDLA
jgi:hypothetical protein